MSIGTCRDTVGKEKRWILVVSLTKHLLPIVGDGFLSTRAWNLVLGSVWLKHSSTSKNYKQKENMSESEYINEVDVSK